SFFFFQAADGIRAFHVTGVQTCALPISASISQPCWPGLYKELSDTISSALPFCPSSSWLVGAQASRAVILKPSSLNRMTHVIVAHQRFPLLSKLRFGESTPTLCWPCSEPTIGTRCCSST